MKDTRLYFSWRNLFSIYSRSCLSPVFRIESCKDISFFAVINCIQMKEIYTPVFFQCGSCLFVCLEIIFYPCIRSVSRCFSSSNLQVCTISDMRKEVKDLIPAHTISDPFKSKIPDQLLRLQALSILRCRIKSDNHAHAVFTCKQAVAFIYLFAGFPVQHKQIYLLS